jgi:hypothetical protein
MIENDKIKTTEIGIIKDWKGNKKSVFTTLGASAHAVEDRQVHDYYSTPPQATELLLELETFNLNILEPCCGGGHVSEVLKQHGHNVDSYDLIDRGYEGTQVQDFLNLIDTTLVQKNQDVITNPPYSMCNEFIERSLDLIENGNKVVMFMGLNFVEGKKRKEFLKKFPIKIIHVSSSRLNCAKNGDFEKYKTNSARCYAWFIWEKGWKGETILKWFN